MKAMTLKAVTWTTVTGVVSSALWLAAAAPSVGEGQRAQSRSTLTNLNWGDTRAQATAAPRAQTGTRPHHKAEPALQVEVAELAPRAH